MAFLEFAHILWEPTKPTIVLTDNKSVNSFFQTKAIPPAIWNACDYVLQFNFKIAHIAGSVNTAADFLSRLELKITEKIRLKISEDTQTTPIEVTTSSSEVADEEHFFFTQADRNNESEAQTFERKEQSRPSAKQGAAHEESSALKTSVKEFTKIHYVVFHECNQTQCTNTSRARCWPCAEEDEIENFRPTTWWSNNDDRLAIQKIQGKWRPHNS